MQKEIKQIWFFNQSPQVVWDHLTKPELIELWLGKTDFQPILGHKFRLLGKQGSEIDCQVQEINPFTKLSYSWRKNSAKDNTTFTSKVMWTLVPKENGTELQLVHDGFSALEDQIEHNTGWTILGNRFIELFKMKDKSYTATIEVEKSPHDVFTHLTDVSKWWGGKDLEGESKKINDEFIIHHQGAHYSKQKLIEVVPDKKIVWLVTDSTLNWLKKDQHEWANTKMIFEITTKGDKTILHFRHEGLVPEKGCYSKCEQGWNMVIKDWLFNFITYDKPHF